MGRWPKNKLSDYVRIAAASETAQVTDRNRIVAKLAPRRRPEQSLSREEIRAKWIRGDVELIICVATPGPCAASISGHAANAGRRAVGDAAISLVASYDRRLLYPAGALGIEPVPL